MPKLFGTSLLGIIAATIGFYMIGWLWYGVIFSDQWYSLTGIPKPTTGPDPVVMIQGFIITLAQVIGLNYVLHHAGATRPISCVKICAIIAVFIALPILAYNVTYETRPCALLRIDFSHILVGYIVAGVVLSFFRAKTAISE